MEDFSRSDSSDPFTGLRVAVTGGTSGLGLALVRELLSRGARVAFIARTRGRVEQVVQEHAGAHGIVGDVTVKDDIHPVAVQVVGELGGLDVLINNASDLGPTPLALLGDTDCEDLERALATNVLGPFRLTKAVLGALSASAREGRGAVVLNVSSDADKLKHSTIEFKMGLRRTSPTPRRLSWRRTSPAVLTGGSRGGAAASA
jgi:NAD(P)-dependent dehydrogenase (short-subunit alcohol dehydrogenase family)